MYRGRGLKSECGLEIVIFHKCRKTSLKTPDKPYEMRKLVNLMRILMFDRHNMSSEMTFIGKE